MTLNRPAWALSIKNLTSGWEYGCTAGDPAPETPPPVRLVDEFSMSWSWTNNRPGSTFEPASATVNLYARDAADLPPIRISDLVQVTLTRPPEIPAGDPVTYAEWHGTITDADATTTADRSPDGEHTGTPRINVRLTITDVLAAARRQTYTGTLPPADSMERAEQLRRESVFITAEPGPATYTLGEVVADRVAVTDLYEQYGKSCPFGWPFNTTGIPVVRFEYSPVWRRLQAAFESYDPQVAGTVLPLVLDRLAPASLIVDVTENTETWDTPGLTSVDACHVLLDPDWQITVADTVNTAVITGVGDPPPTVVVAHDPSVQKVGELRWDIQTQLTGINANYADRFLPPVADTEPGWGLRGVTVLTELMDDAALDRLAPGFWPQPGTGGSQMIAIVGVGDGFDLSGRTAYGRLTGASFTCTGGELTIRPTIQPTAALNATGPGWATYNALDAHPDLSPTTWNDPAELHPADTLRWDDVRLATLPD